MLNYLSFGLKSIQFQLLWELGQGKKQITDKGFINQFNHKLNVMNSFREKPTTFVKWRDNSWMRLISAKCWRGERRKQRGMKARWSQCDNFRPTDLTVMICYTDSWYLLKCKQYFLTWVKHFTLLLIRYSYPNYHTMVFKILTWIGLNPILAKESKEFLGSYALCIKTPKSEADLVSQYVTLRTRTHVTVWLVDWVLVIARSLFSSVGHCF